MRTASLTLAAAAALTVALSASPSAAETTECIEITSVPATITAQGVYCLKGNLLAGISTGAAITVATNNVAIDLNGYKLGGNAAGDATLANGIFADGRKNITIRNGIIRGFFRGIHLSGASGSGHRIEDILADGNKATGIEVQGSSAIILNNQVVNTGNAPGETTAIGIAINSANNSVVAGNIVSQVAESGTATGIEVTSSSAVEISGNRVFELATATDLFGINLISSGNVTVMHNRIINNTTATTAVRSDTSSNVDCVANVIRNYTAGTTGCNYTSTNHVN